MLHSIAKFCFHHFVVVIVFWMLVLAGTLGASASLGSNWMEQGSLKGTESAKANDLLNKELPEQASGAGGGTGHIVFHSTDKILTHKVAIEKYLNKLIKDKATTKVDSISSPFEEENNYQLSKDGTVAYANVLFEKDAVIEGLCKPSIVHAKELQKTIDVEFSGYAFAAFEFPPSELIGIGAALIILLIAFGSLVAAGLPIFTALAGVGIGASLVTIWSHIMGVPNFTSNVAAMVSIGVGIDYALFIVTRYREALKRGNTPEAATLEAMTTAGAAVLFAGLTVVISLLGMLVINIEFINGLAIGTSTSVFIMVLVTLTLVPALLGSPLGRNLDRLSLPKRKKVSDKPIIWVRWSQFIQRRAWYATIGATAVLVLLSIPLLSLRVGTTDEGNGADKQTTRKAYDLLAKGYGPGFNGPIYTVVDMRNANSPTALLEIVETLEKTDNVVQVAPSSQQLVSPAFLKDQNLDQKVIPLQVILGTSPQSIDTDKTIEKLRKEVLPIVEDKTNTEVLLTGMTAGNMDFASLMASRTPYFIGAVLILSFLLLMSVFRSLLVALKAVIMNLLSIGAAYGVIVAVFQWGWLRNVIGVGAPGPIEPWAPMMLFAIVFGLSMDYEVFLLSKIKEEYDETKDNAGAVTHGLAATARVITAAAIIMVCVFGSFIIGDNRQLKLMGLGLSIAVLLDATIVRMLLVPATMELLGDKNWWIPKWLDNIIPKIHVDGVKAEK